MSDRNDFDFEDDFLNDDNEPFDFDEEEGFPSSNLGDEFESDMPEIEEEPEERGPNRTFVVLAGIMIILFVAALAVVLLLATRPTGPSDLELTASQVVMLNLTVEAQLAGTSTQNAIFLAMTQTAAAWTATPSPTLTPSETNAPTDTETPPPHETVTPTLNTGLDLTQQALNAALTATALAGRSTVTPTPQAPAINLDLNTAFATQIAYATQQGAFDQDSFGTRVAAATQVANTSMDTADELALRNQLEATQNTLQQQAGAAATAIAYIDSALATSAVQNNALATQLALVIPAGVLTQAALGTPAAQATIFAVETQSALATLSANVLPTGKPGAYEPPHDVGIAYVQQDPVTQTAIMLATRSTFATQAAAATRAMIMTQAAIATQQAFVTPPALATQAAQATQYALQTREALIRMALGLGGSPTPTNGGLEAVNMTATAIAGAFLTATAQAFTPGVTVTAVLTAFPQSVATQLPQTGIFEDVAGGGSGGIGVLALAVFGLVGVIVVSRRLRTVNSQADHQEPEPPKPE